MTTTRERQRCFVTSASAVGEAVATVLTKAESLREQAQSLRAQAKQLDKKCRHLVAAAGKLVKPRRSKREG
jgi:D-alanyl-D-alanine carboxypeptidase